MLNGCQQCGFALTDQRAFSDHCAAYPPRNRCLDRGIAKVQSGRFHVSLSRFFSGDGVLQCGAGRVEGLATHGFYFHQRFVAFNRGLCLEQRGFGACQVPLSLGQCGLERCRVDLEQHRTRFHVGAFLEVAGQHDPGHTGTYLRHTNRLDTARQFVNDRERFGFGGDGFHFFGGRRGSMILRLFLFAPSKTQCGQQCYRRHDTPFAQTTHHSPGRSPSDAKAANDPL